jgi:hypothetical protein
MLYSAIGGGYKLEVRGQLPRQFQKEDLAGTRSDIALWQKGRSCSSSSA